LGLYLQKSILIILPNLLGGGAERLHVNLANDWVLRGFDVKFVLMRKEGVLLPLLSPEIEVFSLNVERIRDLILPLSFFLRKLRPDVVMAAMWPLTSAVVISWLFSGRVGKLFLSDHENLTASYIAQHRVSLNYLRYLIHFTYPLASGIIAVSNGVKVDLMLLGGLSIEKVQVIYNPAATVVMPIREIPEKQSSLWGSDYCRRVLAVGRLSPQKDHETLIKAFALMPKGLKAKLTILGEGPLREELLSLSRLLGVQESVSLPGFIKDTYPWFCSAELFVSSSRWEGFGNVIVEALECGVPVVSTSCPSGPEEILDGGRYGKLVPVKDPISLASAMIDSLNETHDRTALILRSQDFSLKKISLEYLTYIGLMYDY
jgi:glycosyltransferase involved in cell wall biosynthesis